MMTEEQRDQAARDLAMRSPFTVDYARQIVNAHAKYAPDVPLDEWANACARFGLANLVAAMRTAARALR